MLTECCATVDLGAVLPVLALLAGLLQAPGVGVHGPGGAALGALHAVLYPVTSDTQEMYSSVHLFLVSYLTSRQRSHPHWKNQCCLSCVCLVVVSSMVLT